MRASGRKRLLAGSVAVVAAAALVAVVGSGSGTPARASGHAVRAKAAQIVPLGKKLASPRGWQTAAAARNGIRLVGTYQDSGPAAWSPAKHPTVFITTVGPGYGGFASKNTRPGLVIIDAKTKQVVAWRTYDIGLKTYFEPHGLGVSPDGKWIYIPTGDVEARAPGIPTDEFPGRGPGRTIVVNAKTLRVHQLIGTKSMPHHFKAFTLPSGKQLVQGEDFNWQAPKFGITPGSGIYVLDPARDNRVLAVVNAEQLQGNPYLAFESPNGKYMSIGLPPGSFSDLVHKIDGAWAIIDTKTWQPVKYFPGGKDPIWTAFTPDSKTAYLCDGGSSEVFKVDLATLTLTGQSNAAVNGGYGCHLGWNPAQLWVIEKGEASHNRGKNVGLVDPQLMQPVDEYNTGCIRGDHAMVNPLTGTNELWIACNSSFEVAVFDMAAKKVTARVAMPLGASTHSGAFVQYKPSFAGAVLSDQNGLHGPALARQQQAWAKASSK